MSEKKLEFIKKILQNFREHSFDTDYWDAWISEIDDEVIDEYINFVKNNEDF